MNPARDRVDSRPLAGLLGGLPAAGLCLLALVLLFGGGAPQPAPIDVPGAGPLVEWSLVAMPYLATLAAVTTVGFSLLGGRFVGSAPDEQVHPRALRVAVVAALVWALLSLVAVALLVQRFGAITGDIGTLLGSAQARALLAQAGLAAAAAAAAAWSRRLALPLALAALVPDALAGHPLTAQSPLVAGACVVIHVGAAALWVGGLLALGWLALRDRAAWAAVVRRYSTLALGCVIVLALSGAVAALQRIDSLQQLLGSPYGALVLVKSAVLVALVALGALQRRHVVGRGAGARGRDVIVLTGSELTLMLLVLAVATGLAQTPTPV
jgi:putative copper resistance protein D